MKIRLRGHHLICLNFYKGRGYSQDFIDSLNEIMRKAKEEVITIVEGTDDICRKCPYLLYDKCGLTNDSNNEIITMDNNALGLLGFKEGMDIKWKDITIRLSEILDKWRQQYCINCIWREVCEINETL